MKRLLVLAFLLCAVTHVNASAVTEAWCLNNSANCVCAENYQSTAYVLNPNDVGIMLGTQANTKQCLLNTFPMSMATGFCPSPTPYTNQIDVVEASNDTWGALAAGKLPNRDPNFVQRYIKNEGTEIDTIADDSNQCEAYRPGYNPLPVAKRVSLRVYAYYSTDYQTEQGSGPCGNSKIANVNSTFQVNPSLIVQWFEDFNQMYEFDDNLGWNWPGHSGWGGFHQHHPSTNAVLGAPRNYIGSHTSGTAAWTSMWPFDSTRGHWLRLEMVIRNPRVADAQVRGLDYELWVTDVTAGGSPKLEMWLRGGCTDCMDINGDPFGDFPAGSIVYPDSNITSIMFEFSREGRCAGWQGFLYFAVAKWLVDSAADCTGAGTPEACCTGAGTGPTCNNLMIGAATEMEGGVQAGTSYHAPNLTGARWASTAVADASDVLYLPQFNKFIGCDQQGQRNRLYAFNPDGSGFVDSTDITTGGGTNGCEGLTKLNYNPTSCNDTYGGVCIYLSTELVEIHKIDISSWANSGWADNHNLNTGCTGNAGNSCVVQSWYTGLNQDNAEGFMFLPSSVSGACTGGLAGGCEGTGRFYLGRQGSQNWECFELSATTDTTATCTTQTPPSTCTGADATNDSDQAGGIYDWTNNVIYRIDDNSLGQGSYVCAFSGPASQGATWGAEVAEYSAANVTNTEYTAEGFAFGGGYFVTSLDGTGDGGLTGFVGYVDTYNGATQTCGNNAREGNEVCDGIDLNGHTCITEGFPAGTLSCSSCTSFNTSACIVSTPVTGVIRGVSGSGVTKR